MSDEIILGSQEHQHLIELYSFLWDHGALMLGEEADFRGYKRSYDGPCSYCGQEKHFARRDAAATKEIHLRGYYSSMKKKYPQLTPLLLEEFLKQLEGH